MWLKMPGSHTACKVANECLNLHEQVEVVERNKDDPLPSPAVLWIIKENPDSKKIVLLGACDAH